MVRTQSSLVPRSAALASIHVRIEGQFTEQSGRYWPQLGLSLAQDASDVIGALKQKDAADVPSQIGIEKPIINELLLTLPLRTERKHEDHVNLQEQCTVSSFCKERIRQGEPGRFNYIVDSRVTLCSAIKG